MFLYYLGNVPNYNARTIFNLTKAHLFFRNFIDRAVYHKNIYPADFLPLNLERLGNKIKSVLLIFFCWQVKPSFGNTKDSKTTNRKITKIRRVKGVPQYLGMASSVQNPAIPESAHYNPACKDKRQRYVSK